jgi:hypothetical protein
VFAPANGAVSEFSSAVDTGVGEAMVPTLGATTAVADDVANSTSHGTVVVTDIVGSVASNGSFRLKRPSSVRRGSENSRNSS